MKTLLVIMLMLFTVGSTFGQTSARSVILDRCLADAPEPQFTQEDLEMLYATECDGEELTFTVTDDTTGNDCEWQVIYTYTILCGDNDPITLKTVFRGADQSAPQLDGTIPADLEGLNFCLDAIPEGPDEAEIVAQFTDNCTVLKPINVTKTMELDPNSTDCDWMMTYTYTISDDCGNQYEEDIKVVYSGGDIEAPKLKKNMVIPAGDLNSPFCFLEKPQGPTEADIAALFKDNCSVITETNVTKTGFSKGDNCKWMAEYTYEVVDDCGNAYPPFTIKYAGRDTTPPVLAGVPQDITVDCIDEIPPLPKKNEGPTATDNCDTDLEITVFVNHENLGIACEGGFITRTWTAYDDCGNKDVQMQTITVSPAPAAEFDELAPEVDLSCEDLANYVPANLGYSNGVEGGACSIYGEAEPEYTAITENCGSFVVSYAFEDECGRSISASQTVNVIDTKVPVFDLECQVDALEIRTSEGYDCPADAMISLNVGDEIDVNTGWTVGGYDIPQLAGCVSDNCAADPELIIRVTDKTATQDSCNNELTITFVAEDNCGNISGTFTCSYVVIDDTAPTFTAPEDFTVYTDENCEYIATPDVTGEVTDELDNCNNPLEAKPVDKIIEGECEGELIIERTWTLKDACENFAPNQVQYIYVKDNTAPTFVRPADITIYTKEDCSYDASTEFTGVATDVADNCSTDLSPAYTDVTEPGDCPGEYVITRTWTLTDNCGNDATPQAQRITVLDNIDPMLTVPEDITVECDAVPAIGTATATDNCDPNPTVTFVSENLVDDDGDNCDDTYKLFRIWIATDCSGNQVQKTQVIIVIDTTDPVLTVPESVTVQCDAVPPLDEGAATATDNCDDNVTVTFIDEKFEQGDCADSYYIFRSWSASDCAGNSVTGTQTIIVVDTVDPVLTIPADVTVECDAVPDVGVPTATDNCDTDVHISEVMEEIIPGSCPQTYTIKRTWTATDNCENTDTKTQTIEVQDTHAPVIAPAAMDMVVDCDGNGNVADLEAWLASNGGAEATDNCGEVTWSHNYCDNSEGGQFIQECVSLSDLCGETGSVTVTFTTSDECNNSSSTSATFTIRDITAPTIDIPAEPETVECDGSGNLNQFNAWLESNGGASASDDCSDVVWSNNYCADGGDANAFTVDATAEWLSFDNLFFLNDSYCCGFSGPTPVIGPGNQLTIEPNFGSGDDVNVETNVFIADNSLVGQSFTFSGNVTSNTLVEGYQGTAWIKLFDGGFGLIEQISVPLNEGTFSVEYNNTQPGAVNIQYGFSTFGLGGAGQEPGSLGNVVIEASEPTCVSFSDLCGATGDVTVTFTATDDCGNASSTEATFTIQDTTDPLFSVPADVTIECDQDPHDLELTGDVTDESDACSAEGLEATYSDQVIPGDCPNESSIKRTWTLVDDCDNSYTLIQTITIIDSTPPTIDVEASPETVECDGLGNTDALEAWLSNNGGAVATDNCGPVTWSNNYMNLSDDCGATGSVDVTFTATDACGNTSSTTATFTIEDTIAPTITVPADVTVECDMVPTVCDQDNGNGNGPEPAAWINEFHYDNSGSDTGEFVEVAANFDASAYKLYLYNGSSSSGSSYFDTVLGTGTEAGGVYYYVIPTAGIQNGAPDGIALADASDVLVQFLSYEGAFTGVGGPADGVMSTDIGLAEGSSTSEGESLQLTGTGSAYGDFTWSGPTAETPGATNAGQTIVVMPGVNPNGNEGDIACIVSADDCSDVTITYNGEVREDGDCPNNYTLTRTWTATDACGLSTTKSQVITVQDTVAPTFTAPADTEIFTDANCEYNASPDETGDVEDEMDNCSDHLQATYSDVIADGPCTGSQVITRTWSLVDECSNAAADQVQVITVTDNIAPTFTAPEDLTIDCTDDYLDLVLTGDVDNEMDNCSMDLEATFVDAIVPGDCAGNYTVNRTWSLVDACGNAADDQVQVITVQDIEAPTLAPDAVLPMGQSNMDICAEDALEHTSSIVEGFDIASLYVDNCSLPIHLDITTKVLPGSDDECYWSIMYTIVVSDDCGNEVDAPVKLFFNGRDMTAPTLRDGEVLPVGEDGLQCLASVPDAPKVADITALFEDNCDGDVIVTPLDTVTTGDNCEGWSVTYGFSVSDSCGNFADNVTVTYTGEDTTPPMLVGTPPDSYINGLEGCRDADPGQDLITDAVIRALFEDNCTANEDLIISIVRKPAGTDASWIVTYDVFVSDLCNNKAAMLKFNYAGNDTTPPVISCPQDVDLTCVLDEAQFTDEETIVGSNTESFIITNGSPVDAEATVAGIPANATITDITVDLLGVTHSWAGDLEITLVSPTGVETLLLIGDQGGFGDTFTDNNLSFDDTGASLDDIVFEADGVYMPQDGTFADFIGTLAGDQNGTWVLNVVDDAGGDDGEFDGFNVNITYIEEIEGLERTDPELTGFPTAEDCGEVTFSYVDVLGDDGVTITRTWTATDGAGLTDTCDQIIINATDMEGPVVDCPTDISAECGSGTPEFTVSSENSTTGPITDSGDTDFTTTVSSIPADATLTDITLDMTLSHTWAADLEIVLTSPSGNEMILLLPSDTGGSSDFVDTSITFDDNATTTAADLITNGGLVQGGSYIPNDGTVFFSDIIGSIGDANGDWTLSINDDASGDTGDISAWAVNITYTTPLAGGAVVDFDMPTATDNCDDNPVVEQTGGLESGSLFPVGDTVITYEATDASGNVTTCSFTVSVTDTADPVLACTEDIDVFSQGPTVVAVTKTGEYGPQDPLQSIKFGAVETVSITDIPAGATVTDVTMSIDLNHPYIGDLSFFLEGPNGEMITLMDQPGLPATSFGDSSDASVDGTITFTDAGVKNGEDMGDNLLGNQTVCVSDDICTFTPDDGSFTFSDFIATLGDPNGDWTLTIADDFTSGDDGFLRGFSVNVTYETEPVDGTVVDYDVPTASDVCDSDVTVELTSGLASGEFFPLGDTVVTYTATDASGNTDECSFTITVNENTDTVAPEITCPDDIVVDAELGTPAGGGTVQGSNTDSFVITNGSPVDAEAIVSGIPADATITDISVDILSISHTWASDLDITLVSPTGAETIILVQDEGGSADFVDNNISFDDSAAENSTAMVPGVDATYRPNDDSETFADFIASLAGDQNGVWTLNVVDDLSGDDGEFDGFNVNITYTTPASPDGVVVTYALPTATDDVDGAVGVDYVSGPMSGDFLEPGSYTVTYSATDATGNTDECSFNITVNPVFIARAAVADEKMDFRAYPVPFENEVTIQYMFEYDTNVTIEMFDTKGLLVATKTNKNYMSGSTERVKFDLSRTAVQMLYVKLTTNQGSVTKKIVSGK
ncbi:HYR-like domain-containing protein [Winogradskyella sp.]|uniref:HYR-like domain-containing protein n=1 Tax=Winogradskyella sp. TaxID=1883156 RepID=UPI003F6D465A